MAIDTLAGFSLDSAAALVPLQSAARSNSRIPKNCSPREPSRTYEGGRVYVVAKEQFRACTDDLVYLALVLLRPSSPTQHPHQTSQ